MTRSDLDLDGFQRLLWGFASHRVITVAGRTGILRLLAERPVTPETVASELGLDPLATGKVMRALAALGIADADGDTYRAARHLAPNFLSGDHDVVPFLEHSHAMYERWGETLEPWLRGEDWPVARRTPEETARFGAAMRAMGAQMARRVAASLEPRRGLADARRGRRLGPLRKSPVRDESAPLGRGPRQPCRCRESGHRAGGEWFRGPHRASSAGDYLETAYGSGFDLVLLANILHQETADRARELVRRAARPSRRAVAWLSSTSPLTTRGGATFSACSSPSTCGRSATPGPNRSHPGLDGGSRPHIL